MKPGLVLALAAGIVVLGCSKSEPAPPPVSSAAPLTAPVAVAAASVAPDPAVEATVDPSLPLNPAAPAAAPVAIAKAVPTEADYEVKAETTITPANAAQVLAAIDAQIGK
ncbi:MAG: hypothetical protein ABUL62_02400 [Myxococcales bacterium]